MNELEKSDQKNASIEFTNQVIETNKLPDLQLLPLTKLSPQYCRVRRITNFFFTLFLVVIIASIRFQPFIPLPLEIEFVLVTILFAISFLGGWITLYCVLADPRKRYALRDKDVTYHSGLIFKKTVTQPITRIQHVELKRGPIDRKVGLANIQLFSAGGAMHTFEIPGLKLEIAQSIRQFILDHKDSTQHG